MSYIAAPGGDAAESPDVYYEVRTDTNSLAVLATPEEAEEFVVTAASDPQWVNLPDGPIKIYQRVGPG